MDKRREPRLRSFLQGKVVFNRGQSTMDCVVRNLSPGGLRLAISETIVLPEEFDLHLPQKGEIHRVRLKWRRADEIGVSYVTQPQSQADPATGAEEAAARAAELEAEVARLTAVVLQLMLERDELRRALGRQEPVQGSLDDLITAFPRAARA